METALISGIVGFGLCAGIFLVFWITRRRKPRKPSRVNVISTVEKFKSLGELVVFKVFTKEIITTSDHWFGEMGKKYFRWLASEKKMAMIFEFDIDFKYDLHSPDFIIESFESNSYLLKMPKCLYESHIKNISFYDEQRARLLPWLLPDLLSNAFSDSFSEETKNRLVAEAKNQASRMANELVKRMQSEVQKSARQTLELLAKGFGAERVTITFSDVEPLQAGVNYQSQTEDKKEAVGS
ncbi:MAG: DUF4230 domain-containing protein [Deltaproteobacteria bacterium]|nr:DUF4230 domain-containing protein [Deltaproteobacteria bacterium]